MMKTQDFRLIKDRASKSSKYDHKPVIVYINNSELDDDLLTCLSHKQRMRSKTEGIGKEVPSNMRARNYIQFRVAQPTLLHGILVES